MFCPQVNKNLPSTYDCNSSDPKKPKSGGKQTENDTEETGNATKQTETSNDDQNESNDVSEEIKGDDLTVSDSIAERIENDGGISEDRLTCYDDFWLEKLDNLEKEFAKEKLNIDEADVILNKLSAYTHYKSHDACGAEAMKLLQCYAMFEGQSIRCGEYSKEFINCVDESLQNAVSRAHKMADASYRDKMTYTEKFYKGI